MQVQGVNTQSSNQQPFIQKRTEIDDSPSRPTASVKKLYTKTHEEMKQSDFIFKSNKSQFFTKKTNNSKTIKLYRVPKMNAKVVKGKLLGQGSYGKVEEVNIQSVRLAVKEDLTEKTVHTVKSYVVKSFFKENRGQHDFEEEKTAYDQIQEHVRPFIAKGEEHHLARHYKAAIYEDHQWGLILKRYEATFGHVLRKQALSPTYALSAKQALSYMADISLGLDQLANANPNNVAVTYIDVKPENTLVINGKAYIADFGDVRFLQPETTVDDFILVTKDMLSWGTANYFSPVVGLKLNEVLNYIEKNSDTLHKTGQERTKKAWMQLVGNTCERSRLASVGIIAYETLTRKSFPKKMLQLEAKDTALDTKDYVKSYATSCPHPICTLSREEMQKSLEGNHIPSKHAESLAATIHRLVSDWTWIYAAPGEMRKLSNLFRTLSQEI